MDSSSHFSKSSEDETPGLQNPNSGKSEIEELLPNLINPVDKPYENKKITTSSLTKNIQLQTQPGFLQDGSYINKIDNISHPLETLDNIPSLPSDGSIENSKNTAQIFLPHQSRNHCNNALVVGSNDSSPLSFFNESKESLLPNTDELKETTKNETNNQIDDTKYSPSKVESDEENQEFSVASRPKLLGKEQAKKRLMAFSLSKQTTVATKKPSKLITSGKTVKGKPPHPHKSCKVQQQLRATISAIEEEKKKMLQNMPNYLLMEMNDLSMSSVLPSSLLLTEKPKEENSDMSNTNVNKESSNRAGSFYKRKESVRKNSHRSRSRSKRRTQNQNKRRRSNSRSRRRSSSRSRKRSRSKRLKEDKAYKSEIKGSGSSVRVKSILEDRKNFTETDFKRGKNHTEEASRRKDDNQRSQSPNSHLGYQPIFNYLKNNPKIMKGLAAQPVNSGSDVPVLFPEKTIKYTRTKPIIHWAENPSYATEFYMPRQMLVENCDYVTLSILNLIIENKTQMENSKFVESKLLKSRPWYPQKDYLMPVLSVVCDDENFFREASYDLELEEENKKEKFNINVDNVKKLNNSKENVKSFKKEDDVEDNKHNISQEKRISLVNDSYLSDEELDKVEEIDVGNVKVRQNLRSDSLKVRSKWDSDYENDYSERELNSHQGEDMEIATSDERIERSPTTIKDKFTSEKLVLKEPFEKLENYYETNKEDASNLNLSKTEMKNTEILTSVSSGNLVSEYEEFLKMVSFDFSCNQGGYIPNKQDNLYESKFEKQNLETEKSYEQINKFEGTDWDQESDNEKKSLTKKFDSKKSNACDEFLLISQEKSSSIKKKYKKSDVGKKKFGKSNVKKSKLQKKSTKRRKKKYKSSSSDSSSDSYDTESDSDSVENKTFKKKKRKKKNGKAKKKSKRESSSESDSESNKSNLKKKKAKKKSLRKKKHANSDIEEEVQNALLKQLDFKKQLIMKKIEEIDSISERTGKKKELENKQRKKEKDIEESKLFGKILKPDRKQKGGSKTEFDKNKLTNIRKKSQLEEKSSNESGIKNKSSSDSYIECSADDLKKVKKKNSKKKYDSSGSSESEEIISNDNLQSKGYKLGDDKTMKSFEKTGKKYIKIKSKKKKNYSSSYSESDNSSSKEMEKKRGEKYKGSYDSLDKIEVRRKCKENLMPEANKLNWEEKEITKFKNNIGACKEGGDWEFNSSFEEFEEECKKKESSWDDEALSLVKPEVSKKVSVKNEDMEISEKKNVILPKKEAFGGVLPPSESLKTSLSNFSFNENSFCSFEQELSRDFFLTERSSFSSVIVGDSENCTSAIVEPRPFQSVSKINDIKKPQNSELYSPGYSDSEQSDMDPCSKTEMISSNSNTNICYENKEVYDPLKSESEASIENNDIELSSIPLPDCVSDILLPGEERIISNKGVVCSVDKQLSAIKSPLKDKSNITFNLINETSAVLPKYNSASTELMPISVVSNVPLSHVNVKHIPTKRAVLNMKPQQKLKSKAASVFQNESDDETLDLRDKHKINHETQKETAKISEKNNIENKKELDIKESFIENNFKETKDLKTRCSDANDSDSNGEKIKKKEGKRSTSRDRRDSFKPIIAKSSSPSYRVENKTPESRNSNKEAQEIKSDSFEIEPLQSSTEMEETIQPIPVLTGLGVSSCDQVSWDRAHILDFTCSEYPDTSGVTIDNTGSFDIYSDGSKFRSHFLKEFNNSFEESNEKYMFEKNRKDRRKSRSKSLSPKKKRRSKSPERRKSPRSRSPKRRSSSPKRREKSPYSPRKRSPKRKSSPRRYRNSRSPDRRRKSRSRSPRKRRRSPRDLRRSRSLSPKRHRSPKGRATSPKKRDSLTKTFSPRKSDSPKKITHFSHHLSSNVHQNRIPVLGASNDTDMEISPSTLKSPIYDSPVRFPQRSTDPNVTNSEIDNSFYNLGHANGFETTNYAEEVGINNLITVKNHDFEKVGSPERLSLDQRIELELGVQLTSSSQNTNEQYQMQQFEEINPNILQNSYNCENNASSENFYQNQSISMNQDFSNQYFNGSLQQPSNYSSFHQYPNSQAIQSSVMQVGNIVEVVPTLQQPPPPPPPPPGKVPQVMQVGNVLQVVPSQKVPLAPPVSCTPTQNYGPPTTTSPLPPVKTQKATAVVAPSSIVLTPNTEIVSPLIKAIQWERKKRRQEKQKRRAEREVRRKARQLRREAKLMSVNEKLKKSVMDEGLMLGQEVEDDELLDSLDIPSPPVPLEIISVSALPPTGKGILITAGFMPKPPSEKKEVKFADGVLPGEGTSTSGGEDIVSPPPKPKLPKEKRYKKKKMKVKKKVKVHIIKQILHNKAVEEDDDDDDAVSPPPPPLGEPPQIFFARFPFSDAQFPVYPTQAAVSTVQFPS